MFWLSQVGQARTVCCTLRGRTPGLRNRQNTGTPEPAGRRDSGTGRTPRLRNVQQQAISKCAADRTPGLRNVQHSVCSMSVCMEHMQPRDMSVEPNYARAVWVHDVQGRGWVGKSMWRDRDSRLLMLHHTTAARCARSHAIPGPFTGTHQGCTCQLLRAQWRWLSMPRPRCNFKASLTSWHNTPKRS